MRYVYDAQNRLLYTLDGIGAVTKYTYDAKDNVIETI